MRMFLEIRVSYIFLQLFHFMLPMEKGVGVFAKVSLCFLGHWNVALNCSTRFKGLSVDFIVRRLKSEKGI